MVLSIEAWQSWVNDPFFHLALFHSQVERHQHSFEATRELDKLIDENMHQTNLREARRPAATRPEDPDRRRRLGHPVVRQLDARGA